MGLRDTLAAVMRTLRTSGGDHTVALLHPGRCGSTVVGTMLGDREDVHWDGEIFEPNRRHPVPELEAGLPAGEVLERRRDQAPEGSYLYAVKYLWSHHLRVLGLELDELVDALERGGTERWVLLHRRNYLRRVVSGAVGRERGTYHQRRADGPAELVQVTLDVDDVPFGPGAPLLDVFAELARGERELGALLADRETLWLTYEDDIEQDPRRAYEQVCDFLGLPSEPVDVRLRRTTPFPLSDVVRNLDEVRQALDGTPHAWMLEDESE